MGATVPPFWQDDSDEDYHTTRCFSFSLEFFTLLVIHTAGMTSRLIPVANLSTVTLVRFSFRENKIERIHVI